ncbi:MAG: hypothetical protein R2857_06955 [Vampirovibrionales bacterium]
MCALVYRSAVKYAAHLRPVSVVMGQQAFTSFISGDETDLEPTTPSSTRLGPTLDVSGVDLQALLMEPYGDSPNRLQHWLPIPGHL